MVFEKKKPARLFNDLGELEWTSRYRSQVFSQFSGACSEEFLGDRIRGQESTYTQQISSSVAVGLHLLEGQSEGNRHGRMVCSEVPSFSEEFCPFQAV